MESLLGWFGWLLCMLITAVVAKSRGRSGWRWLALGLLLGPFGFVLLLALPKNQEAVEKEAVQSGEMKRCPYCAELIKAAAIKCRFCGEDLDTNIPDDNLRAALEQQLGKGEGGPITEAELAGLTEFTATDKSITHLTGLEHCTKLQSLSLSNNKIKDISALAELTKLERLSLEQQQYQRDIGLGGTDRTPIFVSQQQQN